MAHEHSVMTLMALLEVILYEYAFFIKLLLNSHKSEEKKNKICKSKINSFQIFI